MSIRLYLAPIIRRVSFQLMAEVCEGDQDAIIQLLRYSRPTVEVVSLKRVNRQANGEHTLIQTILTALLFQ